MFVHAVCHGGREDHRESTQKYLLKQEQTCDLPMDARCSKGAEWQIDAKKYKVWRSKGGSRVGAKKKKKKGKLGAKRYVMSNWIREK